MFIEFILKNYTKNDSVLEIGAGDLSLANMLVEAGIGNITVVEKNIDVINISPAIILNIAYLEDVNFTKKFDIVYSHMF